MDIERVKSVRDHSKNVEKACYIIICNHFSVLTALTVYLSLNAGPPGPSLRPVLAKPPTGTCTCGLYNYTTRTQWWLVYTGYDDGWLKHDNVFLIILSDALMELLVHGL